MDIPWAGPDADEAQQCASGLLASHVVRTALKRSGDRSTFAP